MSAYNKQGGDQGLLNLYFSDWATKDISKHLPFIYNLCSTACYSYLPAFKQFGMDAKIIHFIGSSKPWLQYFNTETRKVQPSADTNHLEDVLQHWWNLFCSLIHPQLTTAMARSSSDVTHTSMSSCTSQNHDKAQISTKNIVWDPWEEYDQKQSQTFLQVHSFPEEIKSLHNPIQETKETHISSSLHQTQPVSNSEPSQIKPVESHNTNAYASYEHRQSPIQDQFQGLEFFSFQNNNPLNSIQQCHLPSVKVPTKLVIPPPQTVQNYTLPTSSDPIYSSQDSELQTQLLICAPNPVSPIPHVHSNESEAAATVCKEPTLHVAPCEDESSSGLAGAFAQLTLGAPRTTEQSALDDHLRRQAWEVGNIDYMGKDSFDNIWSKICETLSAGLPSSPKTTGEVQPSSQTAPSQDSASVSQSTPLEQPQTISESKASVEAPTKTSVISEETSRVPSVESGNLQCLLKTGSPEIVQVVASTTETPSLSLPKIGTKVPEPTQEAIPAAPLQDEQASGSSPKVPIIQPSAEAFPTSQNSSETPGVFAETPLPSQPLSEVSSVLLSITPAPSLSSSEVSRASQSSTEASPTQSTTEAKSTEVTSSQLSAESSTTPKPMEVSLSEPSGGAPPASHSTETSSAKTPPTLSASAEVPISKPSTEAVKPIEILPISPPSTETPSTPKSLAEIPIPPTEAPFSESLPSPLSTEASVMPKPTEAPPASSHPSTEALPTSPPHAETPSTPKSSAEIPITPTETSSCESLPFQPSTEAPMMSKPTEASPTSQSSPEAKLQAPTPKPSSVVLPRSHPPLSTEASAPQLPTLSKTESLTPSETKTTKSGSEQPKAAKAESATAASSASPTPPPRKAAGSGKKKAKK